MLGIKGKGSHRTMYYSSIGILSLIMHVIINFDTLFRKRNDGSIKMHKKYRPFLFAVMSFYISESICLTIMSTGMSRTEA